MRSILASVLVLAAAACGGGESTPDAMQVQCSDGVDNDGDGTIDFPDDLGCQNAQDDSEDSLASPKCSDGRDNDGDGYTDYPSDPGCVAPQVDDEADDCPDGPACPACADGKDNDGNGATDYPDDPGCTSASDALEFLSNPVACGAGLIISQLPTTNDVEGTLEGSSKTMLQSPCGGLGAPARAYELHLSQAKVVEISTEGSSADTIVSLRSEMCSDAAAHIACNDDASTSVSASKLVEPLLAGDYYIIVSGADAATTGNFQLTVKLYNGEGTTCGVDGDCGPGLVCRTPLGQNALACAKPRCGDNVDEDGDGKPGYPTDPGCTSPTDNDESDDCPNGPNCPECADGVDNDGDGATDYGMDTTCSAAGDVSEACVTTDGVTQIVGPMTMGTTVGANNDGRPSCAGSATTHTAPDRTYRLDLPALTTIDLNLTGLSAFDTATALYNSTCGGTAIKCSDPAAMNVTNLAAGTYYFVVDGYSTAMGAYTINVSGKIQNGGSCESVLAQSGALTCGTGYSCKGPMGSRTCQPGLCGDGIDNDGDGKIDYPFDPGCDSLGDDTEENPATLPVCGNGADDDGDSLIDFPADYGCAAASATTEAFCPMEADPTSAITTKTTMSTTAGKANNFNSQSCITASGPDITYGLSLPVPVQSLVIDTVGSNFDTVLSVRDTTCTTSLACNDQAVGNQSRVTLTNVAAGNYAVQVDGWSGQSGNVTLNVVGTVAPMTPCGSPLFQGGANAVLVCPMGTTCTGTPARCQ